MRIVFVSHSFYGPYFVLGSHHLSRQLARRGHSVWHISPVPFFQLIMRSGGDKARSDRFFRGVVDMEPNLKEAVVRPLLPWQVTRKLRAFGNLFVKASDIGLLTWFHPELRKVDVLVIDEPRLDGIEKYIEAKSIYYRPTDHYADYKNDVSIEETEARLLHKCRGVIATSEPVMARMLALRSNLPHLVLTNGVDDAFSTPQDEPGALQKLRKPRAIYVGAIDQRFDVEAIGFLAGRFPEVSFVIIGDGSRQAELRAITADNVHVLGLIPHTQLSAYLQHCDAGMLPMLKGRTNEGRSPMKLYEYGLSGLPVLATRTAELARRNEDFVRLYSSHEEAAGQLAAILKAPRDREAIAGKCKPQAWPAKAAVLEKFIADTSGHVVSTA